MSRCRPVTAPPPNRGAPRPALRLAVVAAGVVLIGGASIAADRTVATATVASRLDANPSDPACAPLPIVAQHRYRMAAKIRPLLFWIGRDNVGEAQIVWRRGAGDARGFELLIGSDPDRAPRRINRWGYIREDAQGSIACVVGVMKESNEQSVDEAKSQLANEANSGRHVFKAIRSMASREEARAAVTTVRVDRDLTYRDLDEVLGAVTTESQSRNLPAVSLPPGTRPGFLTALAELIHADVEEFRSGRGGSRSHARAPITYVYNGTFHDLTLRRSSLVREWRLGTSRVPNVAQAEFTWRSRKTGEKSDFEVTYGTTGPFAEIPLHASYQPRWWFHVDVVLDDPGAL